MHLVGVPFADPTSHDRTGGCPMATDLTVSLDEARAAL